jgi:hypothetical protein
MNKSREKDIFLMAAGAGRTGRAVGGLPGAVAAEEVRSSGGGAAQGHRPGCRGAAGCSSSRGSPFVGGEAKEV